MAANKSIPSRSAVHAERTRAVRLGKPSRVRRRRAVRSPASGPCACARIDPAIATKPVRDRAELIDRLSNALALVETIFVALREFESEPTLGSICMALNQAIVVMSRAHADVESYLERAGRERR